MFSFFKKKRFRYPETSVWSILQGHYEGRPLMVRKNVAAESLARHPDFAFRVGVAVPLQRQDANGFPEAEESERLDEVEDSLCEHFERDRASIHVLSISTSGMREFVFYTSTPQEIEPSLEKVRALFPDGNLQFVIAQDPTWDVFAQFE